MKCLLCEGRQLRVRSHQRVAVAIYHCQDCDIIFKDPQTFLSFEQQKLRYDVHNNNPEDSGYEGFLMNLVSPLMPLLPASAEILDWGAGPQPALIQLFQKKGFHCQGYDPIYAPELPAQKFAAVVSSEVVEHFMNPMQSFVGMLEYVGSGGLLAGMTQYHSVKMPFESWWYAHDTTHVCFYSAKTIQFLAAKLDLKILFNDNNIFILQKS